MPYTDALDEKTACCTPASSIARSTLTVPVTFWSKVCSGRWTDTPAYLKPATCTTPVTACSRSVRRTRSVSRMLPRTNGVPSGTKPA